MGTRSSSLRRRSQISLDEDRAAINQKLELAQEHARRTGFVYPPVALHTPSSITITQSLTDVQRAELVDRIRGLVFGQAIGDAVGLPTEFHSRITCRAIWDTGHITLTKAVRQFDAGDWSDDTDQMILIIDMLNNSGGKVDVNEFAKRLKCWVNNGFTELGDMGGYGCGQTVGSVVDHDAFESDPQLCAYQVCQRMRGKAASNGAVMRTSILGIVEFQSIDRVISNTVAICTVTHADPRCIASTIMCTVSIALTLQNCLLAHEARLSPQQIIERAFWHATNMRYPTPSENDTCTLSCLQSDWADELHVHCNVATLDDLKLDDLRLMGYTYKCIGSGVWAMREADSDFRRVLTSVTMSGGDADTNGAVAGAMLGCQLGYSQLDEEWKSSLLHQKWLDDKVDNLLRLLGVL